MSDPRCNACRSADIRPVRRIRSPYVPHLYTLRECLSCGSRSFQLDENPADLYDVYTTVAEMNADANAPFAPTAYWTNEVRLIGRLLGRAPGAVLDIGCRTGELLLHWPVATRRVGVEFLPSSAAVARARGLEIHNTPVEALDPGEVGGPFDVVSCYAVLEHVTDVPAGLDRLAAMVAPGGVLAVLVPCFETMKAHLLDALRFRWHMYSPPEHLNLFSRRFLDGWFSARSFRLVARRYTSGGTFNPFMAVPLMGGAFARAMWWLDTRGPLRHIPLFDHMYSYYMKV